MYELKGDLPEGFKMTELGPLPEEWKVVKLGDCLDLLRNGITKKQNKSGRGLPVSRIETISTGKVNVQRVGYILGLSDDEIERYKLQEGDILFSHINSEPYLGNSAIYENNPQVLIHGMNLLLFRTKASMLDSKFLNFLFNYYRQKRVFLQIASRSVNQSSINQGKIKTLLIPLPPLPEQEKIAAVLSTVQEAKEKTEAVISAARDLKKSMMSYLFTYGPVPLPEAENVLLKETEVGMIPEEWEVVRLGDVADFIMGQSPPGSTYNEIGEGFPFLQGKAEFGPLHPIHIKHTTKPMKIAPKNSVLLSVRAPVGDVNLADIDYCIGRGLASLSLSEGSNLFLFYVLSYLKGEIEKEGTGSTFKAITKIKLMNIKIPLPPLPEQEKIASILSAIDQKIEAEEDKKKALEDLFKTLLHNLMTAKIRVNNLEVGA